MHVIELKSVSKLCCYTLLKTLILLFYANYAEGLHFSAFIMIATMISYAFLLLITGCLLLHALINATCAGTRLIDKLLT